MRHNKRIIYFKNIYKTDLREHTYTVNGLINGRGAYIQVGLYPEYNIRWQMDGLISGGLKTGGGFVFGPLSLLYSQPIQF